MLNLRRTFWKENVYSASYRWGSDVPLFTNILALLNPIGSGKILKVLQIDLGASASNNITVTGNITLFTAISGASDLSINIIKYNPNSPNSIAEIYGGGSLTLDKVLSRKSFNFSNLPSETFDFKQEFELHPGQGLCVINEAESSGNIFLPYVTFNWWE